MHQKRSQKTRNLDGSVYNLDMLRENEMHEIPKVFLSTIPLAGQQLKIKDYTLCVIFNQKSNEVLLKQASRGISIGKWNFTGGQIEDGETVKSNVVREVKEETGLTIREELLVYHGKKDCYHDVDDVRKLARVHVLSATEFEGTLKERTAEGIVRWCSLNDLPANQMWKDTRLWLNYIVKHHKNDIKYELDFQVHYNEKQDKILFFDGIVARKSKRGLKVTIF